MGDIPNCWPVLAGKVAIVTGASKGIGAVLAQGLAAAGAAVVVNYRNDAAGARRVVDRVTDAGGRAVPVRADVANQEEVLLLVARAMDHFGACDIVINNAGHTHFSPASEVTAGDWEDVVNTNLRGAFALSVAAAEQMEHGGAIVNISSCAARVVIEHHAIYAMSKTGLEGLSKQLAVEYAARGIRVNIVAPGATLNDRNLADDPAYGDKWAAVTPLRRVGVPHDLIGPVVFLASDQSAFVTGQTLGVDGGWTLGGRAPSVKHYDPDR